MALSGSTGKIEALEAVVDIKSSAEKMWAALSRENHSFPQAASDKIHNIEVHEGDWETSGSVKVWKYAVDGTAETVKEKVEIDEANKQVNFTALEGHVLDQYKSFKLHLHVVPKNNEGGNYAVKIIEEYEKLKETDEPPHKYLQLWVDLIQDMDAHIIN